MKRLDNYDVSIIMSIIVIFGYLWAKEHADKKGTLNHGTPSTESAPSAFSSTSSPSSSADKRGGSTNKEVRIAFPLH